MCAIVSSNNHYCGHVAIPVIVAVAVAVVVIASSCCRRWNGRVDAGPVSISIIAIMIIAINISIIIIIIITIIIITLARLQGRGAHQRQFGGLVMRRKVIVVRKRCKGYSRTAKNEATD